MACGSISADRVDDRQIRRQVYTRTVRRLNRTVAGLVIQISVVELDPEEAPAAPARILLTAHCDRPDIVTSNQESNDISILLGQ